MYILWRCPWWEPWLRTLSKTLLCDCARARRKTLPIWVDMCRRTKCITYFDSLTWYWCGERLSCTHGIQNLLQFRNTLTAYVTPAHRCCAISTCCSTGQAASCSWDPGLLTPQKTITTQSHSFMPEQTLISLVTFRSQRQWQASRFGTLRIVVSNNTNLVEENIHYLTAESLIFVYSICLLFLSWWVSCSL